MHGPIRIRFTHTVYLKRSVIRAESRYGPSTKLQSTGASELLHNDRCNLEVLSEVSKLLHVPVWRAKENFIAFMFVVFHLSPINLINTRYTAVTTY